MVLYSEDIFLNEKKVQKIPASNWEFEGIKWDEGIMRWPEGRYVYIHLDFNELISIFEEEKAEYITIEKRGKCLFDDDITDIKKENKKGQKQIIDCNEVRSYISYLIHNNYNGSLSKQDAFAQKI
jgi:hypothetical protein